MRTPAFVLPLVASAAAAAVGNVLPLPMGEIGWEGPATPGGPSVKVWGNSFEDIEAKIKKDHPGFSIYLDAPQEDTTGSSEAPEVAARAALLQKRVNCDTRFGEVIPYYAEQGISNLRRINGNNCWARARHCIRTQCVGGAGIGLCNDNYNDINIPCTRVAEMAEHVTRNCWKMDTVCRPGQGCHGENETTFGQEFDGGNFNVIVGQCSFFGGGERPVKA
ncbi:hypothetical protein F5X68DRAFT_227388 [Plectosphaerella plurivora]|uniref:Uncharacterized protein n=1 Tax=Plectosphaerella plurivora TaxID=936078 RepID=A0A9P8VLW7_9PEZI|nr:hypothetical protein F5X68DRAFT_227388 [Plectosphaerella plurivora]